MTTTITRLAIKTVSLLCVLLISSAVLAAGTLTGKVVAAADGVTTVYPVDIDLLVPDTGAVVEGLGVTNNPDGSYEITDIVPGEYKIFFNAFQQAEPFQDELYDGVACDNGGCNRGALGDVITINEGANTLDIALEGGDVVIDLDSVNLSGPWGDPARNGEGFVVEIYPNNTATIIWFTYPDDSDAPDAEQAWIIGTGTFDKGSIVVDNAFRTSGLIFGEDYDPTKYITVPWGGFRLDFIDQNNATIEYTGTGGTGTFNLQKIAVLSTPDIPSTMLASISGAWVQPGTDGEGFFIEIISNAQVVIFWFTYDEIGNQAWNLGIGDIIGNLITVRESLAGSGSRFGTEFNAADVSLEPFSSYNLEFSDCNNGTISYTTADQISTGSFPIARLTSLVGHACAGNLPEIEKGKLTLTSNPTDPMLSRYETSDGIIIQNYGIRDAEGNLESETGAQIFLPNGETIDIRYAQDAETVQVVHNDTGFRLDYEIEDGGSLSVTVTDPESGTSFTVAVPYDSESSLVQTQSNSKAEPTNNVEKPTRAEQIAGASVTFAEVTVNYCERPVDNAIVKFHIDSNDPLLVGKGVTVFAKHVNDGLYQGSLMEDDALAVERIVLESVCGERPESDAFCLWRTAIGDATNVGWELSAREPEPYLFSIVAAGVPRMLFCDFLLRKTQCEDEPDILYRAPQNGVLTIKGEISKPGVKDKILLEGDYPDGGMTHDFGIFELAGSDRIVGNPKTQPSPPLAGDPYTLKLQIDCADENEIFFVKGTNPDGSLHDIQCKVDEAGKCEVTLLTSSDQLVDEVSIDNAQGETLKEPVIMLLSLGRPTLIEPDPPFVRPNRCFAEDVIWEFDWTTVPGATSYGIQVKNDVWFTGTGEVNVILGPFDPNVPTIHYSYNLNKRIEDFQTQDWVWRVWAINELGITISPKPDAEQGFAVQICSSPANGLYQVTEVYTSVTIGAPVTVEGDGLGASIIQCSPDLPKEGESETSIETWTFDYEGGKFTWEGNGDSGGGDFDPITYRISSSGTSPLEDWGNNDMQVKTYVQNVWNLSADYEANEQRFVGGDQGEEIVTWTRDDRKSVCSYTTSFVVLKVD